MVLSPTVPLVAPPIGRTQEPGGPLNVVPRSIANRMTVPCNLTGMPAISVPCGFSEPEGMPVGLQIMGPAFAEALVLRVAAAYEGATEWRSRRPPVSVAAHGSPPGVVEPSEWGVPASGLRNFKKSHRIVSRFGLKRPIGEVECHPAAGRPSHC